MSLGRLKIERIKVSALLEHPKNPRVHPPKGSDEWEALEKSLAHDYFDPLVWNERNGMLVSGHYRRKVFLEMGLEDVDVVVVSYDEDTHLARMLAANKNWGKWDDSLLKSLTEDLAKTEIDGALAGFLDGSWRPSLEEVFSGENEDCEEAQFETKADECQKKWQVKLGEHFLLGDQQLFCGDCTDPENWRKMLGENLVALVWTDPPYNVDYGSRQNQEAQGGQGKIDILKNDNMGDSEYLDFLTKCFRVAFDFSSPGAPIYVAHADSQRMANNQALLNSGWLVKQTIIWVKSSFTLGRQDYQWQHEPILYGWKEGGAHFWQGGFSQSTVHDDLDLEKLSESELKQLCYDLLNDRSTSVIREKKPQNTTKEIGHPTIKPLNLVVRQVRSSSKLGDYVLDLFGGGGTTLMACHRTGRKGCATELDAKFCAVILERFSVEGVKIERYG